MTTAIVTDSTADISLEIQRRYPLYLVPALLIINDRSYRDGEQLPRESFYRELPDYQILPTTAAPSVGEFQRLFQQIFAAGFSKIIAIHAASNLSGIYNSSRLAAREFNQEIRVVDSEQLSWGLGFQVLAAAEAAAQSWTVQDILDLISQIQGKIHVYALLDSFEYVQRSGRVSWLKARFGSLLQVKPLIQLERGSVLKGGMARSRAQGEKMLLEKINSLGSLASLVILHTNPTGDGLDPFLKRAAALTRLEPQLVPVTTIIGTHVGPNGLGFAAMVK